MMPLPTLADKNFVTAPMSHLQALEPNGDDKSQQGAYRHGGAYARSRDIKFHYDSLCDFDSMIHDLYRFVSF